jgi:ATP-dependent protease HslVU (ClpYQ) peptidase subunit
MTICAYDGKTLATDSQYTAGTTKSYGQKLFVIEKGVIGLAGVCSGFELFVDWIKKGANPDKYPLYLRENNVEALLIKGKGKNRKVFHYENNTPYPLQFKPPFAIGIGQSFALAAMACGKDAVEAVEIAIQFDSTCGGDIQTFTF